MAWATIDQAHAHWPDSASLPDATLTVLLDVATTQCEMFAPRILTVTVAANLDATVTAAAVPPARFTEYDVGATVTGDGIDPGPPGPVTKISAVAADGATATLSQPALATLTGVTLTLARTIPQVWMMATVYQAREVYAAGQRDGDVIGLGDYAIRARPLTPSVMTLLRPITRPMAVG